MKELDKHSIEASRSNELLDCQPQEERRMPEILTGETILAEDYPVYPGYAYVCDGEVQQSPIQGTVADLKRELHVEEVRRCEIIKRMFQMQEAI